MTTLMHFLQLGEDSRNSEYGFFFHDMSFESREFISKLCNRINYFDWLYVTNLWEI